MRVINLEILSHPLNWVAVWTMLLLAILAIWLVSRINWKTLVNPAGVDTPTE